MKVFIVHGDNFLERKEFCQKVTNYKSTSDFSCKVLDGNDDISWFDVLGEIESGGGFFNLSKAVWIKNFNSIKKVVKNSTGEAELVDYISSNTNLDYLVIFEENKIDKRKSFFKKMGNIAKEVEFKVPYPDRVRSWIVSRAKEKYNLILDDECAYYVEILTSSIFEADCELEKISFFLPEDKRRVSKDLVAKIVGEHRVESINELQDAFLVRDVNRAVKVFRNLISSGEDVFKIIYYLNSFLNKMYYISINPSASENDLAGELRIHQFILTKDRWKSKIVSAYTPKDILLAIECIVMAEYFSKSGKQSGVEILEKAIISALKGENYEIF